ncbi:unnamed protein product, partial [Discosporangium mesarthrocarpum]
MDLTVGAQAGEMEAEARQQENLPTVSAAGAQLFAAGAPGSFAGLTAGPVAPASVGNFIAGGVGGGWPPGVLTAGVQGTPVSLLQTMGSRHSPPPDSGRGKGRTRGGGRGKTKTGRGWHGRGNGPSKGKAKSGQEKAIEPFIPMDTTNVCNVCFDDVTFPDNPVLQCERCKLVVHQHCYRVANEVNDGDPWFCHPCSLGEVASSLSCSLCGKGVGGTGGAFKPDSQGGWVHVSCALWVPEVRGLST